MQPCSLTDKVEPESCGARTLPGNVPIQMQAAGEVEVAVHADGLCHQRLDAGILGLRFAGEHGYRSTFHRKVWVSGVTPLRLERTSTVSRSGRKPDGSLISWSRFSK